MQVFSHPSIAAFTLWATFPAHTEQKLHVNIQVRFWPWQGILQHTLCIDKQPHGTQVGHMCCFLRHWGFLTHAAGKGKEEIGGGGKKSKNKMLSWGRSNLSKLDWQLRNAREHSMLSSLHICSYSGDSCPSCASFPAAQRSLETPQEWTHWTSMGLNRELVPCALHALHKT